MKQCNFSANMKQRYCDGNRSVVFAADEVSDAGRYHIAKLGHRCDHRVSDGHCVSQDEQHQKGGDADACDDAYTERLRERAGRIRLRRQDDVGTL